MESVFDFKSVAKAKATIRKSIILKRKALSNLKQNEKSLIVTRRLLDMGEFKTSKAVFCFLSTAHEVKTEEIILKAFRLGKDVLVPLLNPQEGDMQVVRISRDTRFAIGKYGVREPSLETREVVSSACIDFVIAPGLAFDIFGNRIGYGGGHYDKLFKNISNDVTRVAVGYDFQIIESVPHSDFDESVHFIVTETKTLRCQSR
jgi:5-formyltetrahydrofolate cyclo-ligase|tara:strand:+ start:1175 stop:1783 length:609 start_codon:yes stop_codon:yes gene_type:complete